MSETDKQNTELQDFLNLARDRFVQAAEAESATRSASLDDIQFSIGEQWPDDIKASRQLSSRPCLTVNVLPQFIRQVTNEQRQQRPSINVNPVGSGADVDTAEVFQGICRHIEVLSDAEVAYDIAYDQMVRGGFGYWRLTTRYVSDTGDEQDIYIEPIRNQFSVYGDPNTNMPDRSDANWGFIIKDIPEAEFRRLYPNSRLGTMEASLDDYSSIGDQQFPWATKSQPLPTIRVAEYFVVEHQGRKRIVNWHLISALDELDKERTIWSGIPIIGVYGDDIIVDGKRHNAGLVRFAKDPQRAKNYWTSAATELIALAPKSPWIATKKQIGNYTAMYEQANARNFAYLLYDQDNSGGTVAPPPQRNVAEVPIQPMVQMLALSSNDLQATTGLYQNNLGKQESANESGKAVLARQKQGDINTLNFSDNLARSIRLTGRLIVKAIPKIKTSAQIQRIIKPDQSVSHVAIFNSRNGETSEDALEELQKEDEGIKRVFDVGEGTYDVTVSVGPSYQTKRQEAVATQMALVQADPQLLMPIIGDIVIGNMDIPGAQEIAKRLKKMLPQPLQDQDDPEAQQQALMAQHAQMVQHVNILSQQLQQAQQVIQTKQVEQQGKAAVAQMQELSRQEVVRMQEATKLAVAQINASKDANQSFAQDEIQKYQIMHDAAHEQAMATQQQAHDKQMATMGAQQDQESQQSDQTHELGMAAVGAAQQSQNGNGEE